MFTRFPRKCGACLGLPQLHYHWSTMVAGVLSLCSPVYPTLYHNLIRNNLCYSIVIPKKVFIVLYIGLSIILNRVVTNTAL